MTKAPTQRTPGMLVPLLLALLMLLTLGDVARAEGTPAGTVIRNEATADAVSDEGVISARSNAVETVVQAVCAVSVTPDGTATQPGQVASLIPGERAVFAYRVLNAGNAPHTLNVSWAQEGTLTFDAARVKLYRDVNDNGALDAGEAEITSLDLSADEAASVLLVAQTQDADRGVAYLGLVASCSAALGGASDANNLGRVEVGEPPRLSLTKSFAPDFMAPGGEVSVTLNLSNTGEGTSRETVVEDALNTAALRGLTFEEGSAAVTAGAGQDAGSVTYENGVLRWTIPSVGPQRALALTFKLRVAQGADLGARENVATLTSSGATQEARATLRVRYTPGLALGPAGNALAAPGGEMSDSDLQRRDFGVVGQEVCFVQSMQNTGNVDDTATVTFALERGEADVKLLDQSGQPLAPLALASLQSAAFRVCVTPKTAGGVRLVLSAASARGAEANRTADEITRVASGLPSLVKRVTPEGTVTAGQALTYTLEVRNPYGVPLTNVVLRDALSGDLVFVSASDGGALSGGAVTWRLAGLAPGETRRVTLDAKVSERAADGASIENRFTLVSDETPGEITSPAVTSPVWTASLAIEKTVAVTEAALGDRVVYSLRPRNLSQSGELTNVTLTDTLPVGLVYEAGSSTLNGAKVEGPVVNGRILTWTLATLAPNTTAEVQYAARVTPEASGDLTNTVTAQGLGWGSVVVASGVARAKLKVRPGLFERVGDLIGTVFVDRDRDGTFDPRIDTPLARARVILADGRQSLTDLNGRYHFANVGEGFAALRLDPGSVPYPALGVPQDGGLAGSRGVQVRGLTSVDFPLQALMGNVAALRATTLKMGPLTLGKTLRVEGDEYTVRLTLNAAQALSDFSLTDALPEGAQLLSGQSTLNVPTLNAGTTTLEYRFRFHGPAERATTDPTVRWRLP